MNAIVARVRRRGRVTFAEFMEMALYDPDLGYYTRRRTGEGPVGGGGDFITAPTASPFFGRLLARLLTRLVERTSEPVTLVELGAGEGFLLACLAEALGRELPTVIGRAVAIEAGAWARERIAQRCPWVEVAGSLSARPRPLGAVVALASELYDALPVHRLTLRRRNGDLELAEYYVEPEGEDSLRWVLGTPSSPEVEQYLAGHGVTLEEGQVAEVRLGVRSMHAEVLRWCGKDGLVLVLDYGFGARQLYNPRGRRPGSLVGYRAHSLVDDVLLSPGEVDITSHVNFDDLDHAVMDAGWQRGPLLPLGVFMTFHGALELLPAGVKEGAPLGPEQWAELSAAKRLLMPGGLGSDLKLLAHGRGRLWRIYEEIATPPPDEA